MKTILIITAFILTFQCSKKQEEDVATVVSNDWTLEYLVGFEHSIIGNKGKPTIKINLEDLTYSGHTGCNNYSGKIAYAKGSVKLMPALMTKMACDDNGLEIAYMEVLHSFKYYKLEDRNLKLFNDDKLIAVFKIQE